MGLIGIIIAVLVLVIIFAFSYLSNSPDILTPEKSNPIQTEAQKVLDGAEEKAERDRETIDNIGLP